jgi:phage terminase large subunit-like protein
VNNDKTRDILQKELFGDPIEWEAELGTGWIPLDCIGKIQKKRGVPDAFYNVRIKHHDSDGAFDGWSKVVFLAYEMGKTTWMAHKADVTHLDEEPPMDILEQAARSGIATGGRLRLTFTPESGVTNVVKMVQNDWSLHTAEWKDVAGEDFEITLENETFAFKQVLTRNGKQGHLTQQKVLDAAKKIPVHSMKMRMQGIPVLGSGLVFRFPEDQFKIQALDFPDHFKFLDAIDFGGLSSSSHPTAFARGAYDPTNDRIIIYDGFRIQGKEIPEISAHIVMKPDSHIIPVSYPHDGNKMGRDGTTRDQYARCGVNMCEKHCTNPPRDNEIEGKGGNRIMPGIDEMSMRMNDGRFVVVDTVYDFWEEYRGYHMKDGKIVDVDDDFMSAVRYIVMYIRHAVTLEETVITFNSGGGSAGSGWMCG